MNYMIPTGTDSSRCWKHLQRLECPHKDTLPSPVWTTDTRQNESILWLCSCQIMTLTFECCSIIKTHQVRQHLSPILSFVLSEHTAGFGWGGRMGCLPIKRSVDWSWTSPLHGQDTEPWFGPNPSRCGVCIIAV